MSARDGLQAEPAVLPVAERVRWVERLLLAGVPEVEAGVWTVVCVVSATEVHSRANFGRSVARVLTDLEQRARRNWQSYF